MALPASPTYGGVNCLGDEMVSLARNSLVCAAALAAFACSTAIAAPVTSTDPATVVAALQNGGYKAKLTTDEDSDVWVETASDGNDIRIAFLDCDSKKSCSQIEFIAFWNCEKEVKRCEKLNNTWNSEEVFAHTIMIDSKIAMYRHLLLDEGGSSEALFIKNFEFFSRDAARLMEEF
ncbi:YbjN domain-containing protein [Phenylobacterium sp.]|uniref:YbjN domain-containing protein n=1 Tax=Phenylobacterium sp. TaxID=1871053 RepID=UPI0030F49F3C